MKISCYIAVALLLSPWIANGQVAGDPASRTAKKFDDFRNHYLQEKIFVHTDRSFYLAGETIWLKLYCVNASSHQPLGVSKVAYIEIMDNQQKAVVQTKVEIMDDGSGNGAVFIPVSVNSGHYVVRSYTQWMKNFNPDLYFQQVITVVNPFIHLPPTAATQPRYDVQFFPEGGNLVNGIASTVGFRAVDQRGYGVDLPIAIVDEQGDTIIRIKPLVFGIGKFSFTPSKEHTYRATFKDAARKSFFINLPAAFDGGLVMNLSEDRANKTIKVHVTATTAARWVHLLAHTREKVSKFESHMLQGKETEFVIEKNLLGDGLTHITLFNEFAAPVCERLYFNAPSHELAIAAKIESPVYGQRSKVNVNVTSDVGGVSSPQANLSVAVYPVNELEESGINIQNYLLLSSDLRGTIESPNYYFEKDKMEERAEAVDNLMLTHGWVRFKWEEILTGNKIITFVPENNGHIISAKITDRATKAVAPGIITYLTASGVFTRPYVSRSNNRGEVTFEVKNFYGSNELIAQTNWQVDSTYRMEIISPFSSKPTTVNLPDVDLNLPSRMEAEQRSIHMQVQNIFNTTGRNTFRKPTFDSTSFYGIPDQKFRLDDYTRFPTMEEVMREFVRGVQVRKHRDGFHFMNYDLVGKTTFEGDPFLLLDGVPVFEVNKIMAIDPRLVKNIEVMSRKFYSGAGSFDGIVSYRTYRGDLGGFQPDPRSLIMAYEGLQRQREFFSPKYETTQQKESTLPDTRTLLYWSPKIVLDKDGKGQFSFYTADLSARYKIVIQGISPEGVPGYSTSSFEVKDKPVE